MVAFRHLMSVILMHVAVFTVDSRSVPFKIPQTHPTELAAQLTFVDVPPTQKHNIEENTLQSSEEKGDSSKGDGTFVVDQLVEAKGIPKVEERPKENYPDFRANLRRENDEYSDEPDTLSRFYRNGERLKSGSDAIVFPSQHFEYKPVQKKLPASSSSSNEVNYRHSSINMPTDNPDAHVYPNEVIPRPPKIIPLLSPSQEELTYELLAHLIRAILLRSPLSINQGGYPQATEGTFVNPNQNVNFQSLYSGPRFNKNPCPAGQHRGHNGLCQEASRKLLNSRG